MNAQRNTENSTLEGRTVDHSKVVMSQVFMPQHTGPGGFFVHGGEIIKLMDTAAGLTALRHSHSQVVTLRIEGINFHYPIRVGNYVTVEAKLTFASRSSMEIQVQVTTEDVLKEKSWEALIAYFIFVAVDKDGKTKKVPPVIVSSEEERKLFEDGETRHSTCRIDEQSRTLCAMD
ncbi:MAG: acyl-CoA thioesterase [Deltaproteobacteria bacterium]|nr:acyl-CoA thioesterase [Deltaproteobacteria bacterium]